MCLQKAQPYTWLHQQELDDWPATRIIYGMLLKRWWNDVVIPQKILGVRNEKILQCIQAKCEITEKSVMRIVLDWG